MLFLFLKDDILLENPILGGNFLEVTKTQIKYNQTSCEVTSYLKNQRRVTLKFDLCISQQTYSFLMTNITEIDN